MTAIHEENDWSSQFEMTPDDLEQVADGLERDGVPQVLEDIALRIIRGRLEHDHDPGPAVEKKLQSEDLNQQAEDILLKYGERILSRLADALQFDSRFTSLEGKWFIANKLPRVESDGLQKIHRLLLQNPSASEDEILSVMKADRSTDQTGLRMAFHAALGGSPEYFENTGTLAHPHWKARLPDAEQAEVTHYAYDPQSYEILCRPGQRLSPRKAERLQELNLYAYVVTFSKNTIP